MIYALVMVSSCDFYYGFKQVFDQDIGQDKKLGIAKFRLIELEPETPKEITLNLLSSLDTLKVKDKKDRGNCTIKVHLFVLLGARS